MRVRLSLCFVFVVSASCSTPGASVERKPEVDVPSAATAAQPSSPGRELVAALARAPRLLPTDAAARTLAHAIVLPDSEAESVERDGAVLRPKLPLTRAIHTATVSWPAKADGPFSVVDDESGMRIEVRLRGANAVEGEVVDRHVAYPGALNGAGVVHRAMADGTEDYIAFDRAPAEHQVSYDLKLVSGVQGLRFAGETLEMLDAKGTPRLRMNPPYLVGADGNTHRASIAVHGCAYDKSLVAPWDRKPTPSGAEHCEVRVSWDGAAVAWPAVLDPAWTSTGNLINYRARHTATLLNSGKVLVAGGYYYGSLSSAELYDPATGTWASTGSLGTARSLFTSSLLTNGTVIAVGGQGTSLVHMPTTEIYDPATGIWTAGGTLLTSRRAHSAVRLPSGQVLVMGGYNGGYLNVAELYDPTTGVWTATGMMAMPRSEFAASVLSNGRVIVTGGTSGSAIAGTELYDPVAGTWSSAGMIPGGARYQHAQELLPSGKLLVSGGLNSSYLYSSALYDPAANSWTAGPNMYYGRYLHTLTLVAGKVLASGGSTGIYFAELYDPATNTWISTPSMYYARSQHSATLLNNGKVLVAAGSASSTLRSAELYTPAIPCTQPSECTSGNCTDGYCCDTICGGGCDRCNLPNAEGICTRLTAGTTGVNPSCNPYLCSGVSNDCPTSCTSNSNCVSTYFCSASQCVPKYQLGTACTNYTQCLSGYCADGVCCNESCSGQCDACTAALGASANGTCTLLTGPGSPVCSPYVCDGVNHNCPTSCTSSAQCISGYYCNGSYCTPKKQPGASCTTPGECAYGFCADGYCCDTACDQPCDRCNISGWYGTCRPSPAGYNGSCNPYVCDGTHASCPTSCTLDTDCFTGFKCTGNVCVAKPGLGTPCSSGAECQSGACADGVCCNSSCAGSCNVCLASLGATADGTCTNVSGPGSPTCSPYLCMGTSASCPYFCSNDSQCVTGYRCNGSGCVPKLAEGSACSTSNMCLSGYCADGYCCNDPCIGSCNTCAASLGAYANGHCTVISGIGTPSCSPYTCDGMNGVCPTSCMDDSGCAPGFICPAGVCVTKYTNGTACTDNHECQSGSCSDGYCCDHPCGQGGCDRCDLAGQKGLCMIAPKGNPGANPSCGNYVCNGNQAACPTTCQTEADCISGYFCSGGACVAKLIAGAACGNGLDCQSGMCVDGVCCTSSCTDQCAACNVQGSAGTCTPVVGAPVGQRPACGGTGSCVGACNGTKTDGCTFPGGSTQCAPAKCENNIATTASTCNGAGVCNPGTDTPCGSAGCSGTVCASTNPDGGNDGGMPDAADDAQDDAAMDAMLDGSEDAASDGNEDAIADAKPQDSGKDGAVADAKTDAADAKSDVGSDAKSDVGTDAKSDVMADAKVDSADPKEGGIDGAAADAHQDSGGGAGDIATEDTGGCGCRVAGARSPSAGLVLAGLALAMVAVRRRRRTTK